MFVFNLNSPSEHHCGNLSCMLYSFYVLGCGAEPWYRLPVRSSLNNIQTLDISLMEVFPVFHHKFCVYLHIRLETEYIIFAYKSQKVFFFNQTAFSRCVFIYLGKGVFSLSEVTSPLQHQRSQRADVLTSEQADELTGITAMPYRGRIMGWCCGGGKCPVGATFPSGVQSGTENQTWSGKLTTSSA